MLWLLLLMCHRLPVGSAEEQSIKSKYISTNLDAKWNQTPLIHEVSEYLSEENAEYFWDFVDQTCLENIDTGKIMPVASSRAFFMITRDMCNLVLDLTFFFARYHACFLFSPNG